jgi:hypothetical protein
MYTCYSIEGMALGGNESGEWEDGGEGAFSMQ